MINVLGYNLYYESFEPPAGNAVKGTVLCLHGGPGVPHNYILPMADLSNFGYRVVFYDQLGVGRSEMPKNRYIFSIEYGVEEVEAFRVAMGLGKVNLFGSSYGGLLAIAYALKYQRNLRCMITAGGLASVPLTVEGMQEMKSELPPDTLAVMEKYESVGEFDNPEYVRTSMGFYRRHVCRLPEWPEELQFTVNNKSAPVYNFMNGPNEFTIIGSMKYWDVTGRLPSIKIPTFVTGGRYDEVSTKVAESIHRGIRGSKKATFENSSHTPFWEEREKYIRAVARFLDQVQQKPRPKRRKKR
jgi:proline iminopeptidase